MRVHVGCSGWSYDDRRGPFYAHDADPARYLEADARVFRFVGLDGTFYRAPTSADAERWARATPEGFLFSPKLPRADTREARLRDVDRRVDAFLEALAPPRRAGRWTLRAAAPAELQVRGGRRRVARVPRGVTVPPFGRVRVTVHPFSSFGSAPMS